MFRNATTIQQRQITSNRYVLAAQNAVAQRPPNTTEAQRSLESFFRYYSTSSTNKSTFADSIFDRLHSPEADRRFWIELQSDISRLSPTGHIISRTRKVDAIPNRPKRDARWTRIKLSGVERKIYEHIEDICRRYLPSTTSSWGMQMALLTAYRMTASCIPAALSYFEEKIGEGEQSALDSSTSDQDDDARNGEVDDADVWSAPLHTVLSEMLGGKRPSCDSKFDDFLEALQMIWDDDKKAVHSPRKVVVFSVFRRTIEYLSRLLSRAGVRNRYIHGGVNIDDRETAIDDFLRNLATNVLLTSEVGGEGIDPQKASVIFNYDLPWNPMIVEQRIGRIDRIGQEADRLVIVNFVVQDSVEEQVLQRLLTKIQIFKESEWTGSSDPGAVASLTRVVQTALLARMGCPLPKAAASIIHESNPAPVLTNWLRTNRSGRRGNSTRNIQRFRYADNKQLSVIDLVLKWCDTSAARAVSIVNYASACCSTAGAITGGDSIYVCGLAS